MSVAKQEKTLVTAEELWEMPEAPGKRFELVGGELVEMPGAGAVHGLIVELLLRLIGAYVRDHDRGVALGDGTG
ncbi:MAG: Uma2 family endonuclease, partial [Chloroflexota bacterium]|nr:Uma2 family endonuclease [Chloroflexota bacterium]